jgi:ABC-type antimicrobial peptide transport system permease subunit
LYQTATIQALVCGLCGWLLGTPCSWGVAALVQYFVPQFPTAFELQHALWTLLCAVGMSLVAAVAPARRIARIDPLLAFKG